MRELPQLGLSRSRSRQGEAHGATGAAKASGASAAGRGRAHDARKQQEGQKESWRCAGPGGRNSEADRGRHRLAVPRRAELHQRGCRQAARADSRIGKAKRGRALPPCPRLKDQRPYRSSGRNPVCFATRLKILRPIRHCRERRTRSQANLRAPAAYGNHSAA